MNVYNFFGGGIDKDKSIRVWVDLHSDLKPGILFLLRLFGGVNAHYLEPY